MSFICYIALPRKLNAFRASDIAGREKEFNVGREAKNYHGDLFLFPNSPPWEKHIVISDKKDATFNDCFKNMYVYEFSYGHTNVSHAAAKVIEQIRKHGDDEDTMRREVKKIWDLEYLQSQKILYTFLDANLATGEFAEIYTSWHDHENFHFNPPTSKNTMNLKEILAMPSPAKSQIEERYKLTICKT
jgi:hypothetical protein